MSSAEQAADRLPATPLEKRIAKQIAATGPINVATYMTLAMGVAGGGYYRGQASIGAEGDFITAPETSQIFGELIGLTLAAAWQAAARPEAHLVELGPGNGTLLVDILRATAHVPGFHAAITLQLVEMNEVLRSRQATCLADVARVAPSWHDDLDSVPRDRPLLIVANEFFDALPIRQFVFEPPNWHEVRVDLDQANRLTLTLAPEPSRLGSTLPSDLPSGSVVELSAARDAMMSALAARLDEQGGLALIIDYGEAQPTPGSTLQAVSRHEKCPPLERPGEVDISSRVDFGSLIRTIDQEGIGAFGPVPQAEFLNRLGGSVRLQQLVDKAEPAAAEQLRRGYSRLTDPAEMGTLFKVLAVTSWPKTPPGFSETERCA